MDVAENWRSEYLRFLLSILFLTIWLVQRGSPESKPVGTSHGETSVEG